MVKTINCFSELYFSVVIFIYPLRYARPPNLGGQYLMYSSPNLGEVPIRAEGYPQLLIINYFAAFAAFLAALSACFSSYDLVPKTVTLM